MTRRQIRLVGCLESLDSREERNAIRGVDGVTIDVCHMQSSPTSKASVHTDRRLLPVYDAGLIDSLVAPADTRGNQLGAVGTMVAERMTVAAISATAASQ